MPKILIIQRDNIGDLILTTPLIDTLAHEYNTKIDLLVNSYNQAILEGNPSVGNIHVYSKLHHKKSGQSSLKLILSRLKIILDMRRQHYDVAIIARDHWAKRALQWAKLSGAKRIIAIGNDTPSAVTDPIPTPSNKGHIAELFCQLSHPLGIEKKAGPLKLYVKNEEIATIRQRIKITENIPIYGLQISSRKPQQRWQAEKFIALAHQLTQREKCHILLFWSPGRSDNKLHPGDDEKAQFILEQCKNIPITPVPTQNLRELMASMSLCDQMLTSDGGALHISVGVGVPTVAMFGNSDADFWGPWHIANEVLKAPKNNVELLTVDDVLTRFITLRNRIIALDTKS
ncbi:glycosyltransferase family 9 protein [Proteus terrae]|uniref:glycosyltransferase family 9 protein n=1 Tax=Proteus terrae TaxID=1574161 RepID=UPI00301E5335